MRDYAWIVGLAMFVTACDVNEPPPEISNPELVLIESIHLNVPEPSGLTLNLDGTALYIVSDPQDNRLYKLSLSGEILDTLSYIGVDLEGVTVDHRDGTLWVVEESLAEMVQIDSSGSELQRVSISGVSDGSGGLEGITLNSQNNHFYLLKGKSPGVIIELDEFFSEVNYTKIYFAEDYSGVCYDSLNNQLWIVSDQGEKVFQCDLAGNVIEEFSIDVSKAEGIAVDIENNLIYIVSDLNEKLYIYNLTD